MVLGCAAFAAAAGLLAPHRLGIIVGPLAYAIARGALRRLPDARPAAVPPGELASAVELLAACLDAGAVASTALTVTGHWTPGLLGEHLTAAGTAMAAGLDPPDAFTGLDTLAPLSAVLQRSARSGSAASAQLTSLAEQLRTDEQFDRLERARRVSVTSVLPLGLCLLPAFLLLAVVPAIAGLSRGLLR